MMDVLYTLMLPNFDQRRYTEEQIFQIRIPLDVESLRLAAQALNDAADELFQQAGALILEGKP